MNQMGACCSQFDLQIQCLSSWCQWRQKNLPAVALVCWKLMLPIKAFKASQAISRVYVQKRIICDFK